MGWLYVSFGRWERVQVKLGSGALHMHACMYGYRYTDWIGWPTPARLHACVAFTVLERRVGGQKIQTAPPHDWDQTRRPGDEKEGRVSMGYTEKSTGLVVCE